MNDAVEHDQHEAGHEHPDAQPVVVGYPLRRRHQLFPPGSRRPPPVWRRRPAAVPASAAAAAVAAIDDLAVDRLVVVAEGSAAAGAAAESSAFIAASSLSTWDPADTLSSWAWMSSTGESEVGEGARRQQLVHGPGPGLHAGDLVLGPLHGAAGVAHRLGDPRHRLADLRLRLGRGVAGLQRLLLRAELLDLGLEPLGGGDQLLFLLRHLGRAGSGGRPAAHRGPPAGRGPRGRGPRSLAECGLRLVLQLVGLLLQLAGLELDPLAGGGHVRDAPPDLLETVELLLVGEVEGLAGVLVPCRGPCSSSPAGWPTSA